MVGLFTPDRLFYHGSFMAIYAYAKYKLILGNSLAHFYKLTIDRSLDNSHFVAGKI